MFNIKNTKAIRTKSKEGVKKSALIFAHVNFFEILKKVVNHLRKERNKVRKSEGEEKRERRREKDGEKYRVAYK